jgi:uncharacterized protein (TIGR02646 family)
MRSVKKDFDNPPEKLRKCAVRHMDKLLEEKENHRFKKSCYNHSIRKDLLILYNGKCAYCETKIEVGSNTCVDHYRPKSIYYWLAYEWSNLLPTCDKCNTKKSDKFPIRKRGRAQYSKNAFPADSPSLLSEEPLVIHPEIDNPIDFLTFDADGRIFAKKDSVRGSVTIQLLGLNRDHLQTDRKKQILDIFRMLENQTRKLLEYLRKKDIDIKNFEAYKDLVPPMFDTVFEMLVLLQNPGNPNAYTLLGIYMYEEFDLFFTKRFKEDLSIFIVKKAFQLFRESKP